MPISSVYCTFTLLQAGLSTLLSVGSRHCRVARALARRRFPGRRFCCGCSHLPLALPAIVAILGIVEVYGTQRLASALIGWRSTSTASAAFSSRMCSSTCRWRRGCCWSQLDRIPAESWRLAAQLGFGARIAFRLIEWPAMRDALPGIASLIFLLCAASFAIVLTLGGGPQATTLEVAIYQALRFDFDPARATVPRTRCSCCCAAYW